VSTIIVARDAPSVRAEVIGALEETDREFLEVSEGSQVPPAVDDYQPDLVVLDLQMGNMGAVAVCMELHLEESYGNLPHVPVLILLDRRADVFLARRSNAEGWLVKPLDPLRLQQAADALIAGGTFHDAPVNAAPVNAAPVNAAPVNAAPVNAASTSGASSGSA
jgi:DNA-binding NarL/FixJ family response regulator